jgi:hypothetical protein
MAGIYQFQIRALGLLGYTDWMDTRRHSSSPSRDGGKTWPAIHSNCRHFFPPQGLTEFRERFELSEKCLEIEWELFVLKFSK